jgi:uncharacterized protein YjbI with pentapeptide repeats
MMASENTGGRQKHLALLVIIVVVCITGVLVSLSYWFGAAWTGFLSKTVWDWLQLLLIPLTLALGGYWFVLARGHAERANSGLRYENAQRMNEQRHKEEQHMAQQRNEHDQQVAADTQNFELSQTYFERISELLLEHKLGTEESTPGALQVARARTLSVLRQLDARRKGGIILFLYGASLIAGQDASVVDLSGADLSGADLSGAVLSEVNLSKANLSGADLRGAVLTRADLRGADLARANLRDARLAQAELTEASLHGADLSKADLQNADLSEADLSEANLTGANLDGTNLQSTIRKDTDFTAVDQSATRRVNRSKKLP